MLSLFSKVDVPVLQIYKGSCPNSVQFSCAALTICLMDALTQNSEMAERRCNFPEETYAAVVTSVVASTLTYGAPPCWHTEHISISCLWKMVSHLQSQISFHCTTYIHYKFHIMDSCCLRHKFHLVATSIADFISDVTDFILTSRVTLMADFILLTTLVLCHSIIYFHHKIHITDFISLHFVL